MMVPLSPTINAFSPLSSPASQFLAKEKPPLVSPHLRSSCLRSWSNEQGDTLPMALTGGSPLQDVVIGARPDTSSLSPLCLLPTLWTPTASLRGSTFHSKDFLVGSWKSLKVYSTSLCICPRGVAKVSTEEGTPTSSYQQRRQNSFSR